MHMPHPSHGPQAVHYFFLGHELSPEVDAFLDRFIEVVNGIRHLHGRFVRVAITGAAEAQSFRLFFAEDIVVHLRTFAATAEGLDQSLSSPIARAERPHAS